MRARVACVRCWSSAAWTNLRSGYPVSSPVGSNGKEDEVALDCGPTIRTIVVDLAQGASRALVSIRPHHLRIVENSASDSIKGTVQVVMTMGERTFCEIGTPDGTAIKLTLA